MIQGSSDGLPCSVILYDVCLIHTGDFRAITEEYALLCVVTESNRFPYKMISQVRDSSLYQRGLPRVYLLLWTSYSRLPYFWVLSLLYYIMPHLKEKSNLFTDFSCASSPPFPCAAFLPPPALLYSLRRIFHDRYSLYQHTHHTSFCSSQAFP